MVKVFVVFIFFEWAHDVMNYQLIVHRKWLLVLPFVPPMRAPYLQQYINSYKDEDEGVVDRNTIPCFGIGKYLQPSIPTCTP